MNDLDFTKERVCIGIPCFKGVEAEVLQDYMRWAYYLGRRYTEYDFFLAIKPKSEQFRARNAIVEAAMQVGAKWLLMIDDDHIIDWEDDLYPSERYEFLRTMINHLKDDDKRGIVGALYYTRGGGCAPVAMREGANGGYYWMKEEEFKRGLQEVAVTGGGCFAFRMEIFEKIPHPWFEPEQQTNGESLGTDLQICKKARENGYTVWLDTTLEIGHLMHRAEVVTPKNRHRITAETTVGSTEKKQGLNKEWLASSMWSLYLSDGMEYLGMTAEEIQALAVQYKDNDKDFDANGNLEDYYRSRGNSQVARQIAFHLTTANHAATKKDVIDPYEIFVNIINTARPGYGIDYGCGTSPLGFELAMRGHKIDFIDIPGTTGVEFVKWRAAHRGISHRCGYEVTGPYDYAMFMDSIEHFRDWKGILKRVVDRLKSDGVLITNYFLNSDFDNPEHINMNHKEVMAYIVSLGLYPANEIVWIKRSLILPTRNDGDTFTLRNMACLT